MKTYAWHNHFVPIFHIFPANWFSTFRSRYSHRFLNFMSCSCKHEPFCPDGMDHVNMTSSKEVWASSSSVGFTVNIDKAITTAADSSRWRSSADNSRHWPRIIPNRSSLLVVWYTKNFLQQFLISLGQHEYNEQLSSNKKKRQFHAREDKPTPSLTIINYDSCVVMLLLFTDHLLVKCCLLLFKFLLLRYFTDCDITLVSLTTGL